MARRSAAVKAQTHQHIVQHASRAFRSQGSSVGIGEIMKELGLTHGGFYRHFESKDDLFVEAVTQALGENADRLVRMAEKAEEGKGLEAIITSYLSSEHLLHPETWCALAAMAPDIARQSAAVRKQLDGALLNHMEKLKPYMPGSTTQEQQANFLLLFSGMVGAVVMARVMGDKVVRDQVLGLAREHYLKTFTDS